MALASLAQGDEAVIPDLRAWTYPSICTLGSLTLRRSSFAVATVESSEWFDSLLDEGVLQPLEQVKVDARARNFVLQYSCERSDTTAVHDELREQFTSAVDFVVGRLPQNPNQTDFTFIVFGRKGDSKRMTVPSLSGNEAGAAFRIIATGRGGDGVALSVERLMRCFSQAAGGIFFHRPQETYSVAQLETAVRCMQPRDFESLIACFRSIGPKERTDLQSQVLRIEGYLRKQLPAKPDTKETCQLVDLLNLPSWVRPLESLCNLSTTTGTRLQTATPEKRYCEYTLRDIFANPKLLQRYSIGLHGGPETTGYGKTQCALLLLSTYAKAMHAAGRVQPHERFALVGSTLESAKNVDFSRQGIIAWLLDEFDANDAQQQQYLSEGMMKTLCTPMLMGNLRCKGTDTICLPQGLVRVFTSNASSDSQWCEPRFEFSAPIARKHIFVQVGDRLLAEGAEDDGLAEDEPAEGESDTEAAAAGQLLSAAGL